MVSVLFAVIIYKNFISGNDFSKTAQIKILKKRKHSAKTDGVMWIHPRQLLLLTVCCCQIKKLWEHIRHRTSRITTQTQEFDALWDSIGNNPDVWTDLFTLEWSGCSALSSNCKLSTKENLLFLFGKQFCYFRHTKQQLEIRSSNGNMRSN